MSIKIKYFGSIAEQTGVSEEVLELPDTGGDVSTIKHYCISKYGLPDGKSIQVAVNQELNKTGQIQHGDEIALLPPFSGG